MINLFILVDRIDVVLAAGYTDVRVYSDTSETGAFTTYLGSVPLIARQESVQYTDLAGTASTWYKSAYYGSGVGESEKSDAFKGDTIASYASVLEFRNASNKAQNLDDFEIQLLLDAAKVVIDGHCNRPMGFVAPVTPFVRYYPGSGTGVLLVDEFVSASEVAVKESSADTTYTVWDAEDWIPFSGDPEWPNFNDAPFDGLMQSGSGSQRYFYSGTFSSPRGFAYDEDEMEERRALPMVKITARWGYANYCPAPVKLATVLQATRWFKRGESSWADTMASADTFGMMQYRKSLDPDLQMMLDNARLKKPFIGGRR